VTEPIHPTLKEREPRYSVMLSATVERFGRPVTTYHRVRNLSRGGACIASSGSFRTGETVIVGVGTLSEVGATVRWTGGDHAGLAFAEPIDLAAALAKTAVRAKTGL